jgi:hypothetical protein
MEVLGIRNARVIAYVPIEQLNPFGKMLIPTVTSAFVERYGFMAFPQSLADYDETKGVAFGVGNWNGSAIDRVTIYSNGVLVDTRVSTDHSEAFLRDAMTWLAETLGVEYKADAFHRKGYLSELLVGYDKPLSGLHPAIDAFCNKLSVYLEPFTDKQKIGFELSSLGFGYDPLATKLPLAAFRIERLLDTPFSENKYYAVAPVPTAIHIDLLNDLETLLG